MQENLSKKFSHVEEDMLTIVDILNNDQIFIRYLKNLNQKPLDLTYLNESSLIINQPDYVLPYDLVTNENIILSLFMPKIITEARPYMFFSHLYFKSAEMSALVSHTYVMDIVIPYSQLMMGNQLRNIRLVDEIMKKFDNKFITGIGRLFIDKGTDYVVNDTYQGITLFINIDNSRMSG